jgi:hypothetical protein
VGIAYTHPNDRVHKVVTAYDEDSGESVIVGGTGFRKEQGQQIAEDRANTPIDVQLDLCPSRKIEAFPPNYVGWGKLINRKVSLYEMVKAETDRMLTRTYKYFQGLDV